MAGTSDGSGGPPFEDARDPEAGRARPPSPSTGDEEGSAPRARSVLRRSPRFARLLGAEVISPLGDAMGTLALILHLQQSKGTATAAASVLVAESLPPLLAPWLGAVADRAAERRAALLVACALAQAAVVATLALTLPDVVPLFVLVVLRATFAAIAAPAMGSAIPELVDDADLPSANGLVGGGREIGTILGPALAGALFVPLGVRGVLFVDALTFVAIVPLVATLGSGGRATAAGATATTTVRADALEGLRHLWRTPSLRALALGFWLIVLASASDDLLLVFLATDELGAGPTGVGVLLAAASVGLLVGLATLNRWVTGRNRMTPVNAILLGFLLLSTGNLLTAASTTLAFAFTMQLVRGSGIALLESNLRTHVQRTTPRPLLGRTLSNLYGGVGVAAAAGYVIGGPMLDATDPRTMFVVIGIASLAATAVATALVKRRRDEGAPKGPLDATT